MNDHSQPTNRQQALLDFVAVYHSEHGYSPTIREIGDALDIQSPNGVKCHLVALVRKGFIRVTPRTARSIVLVDRSGQ